MQRITNDLFESIRKVSAAAQEATPTMLNEETVLEDYTKEVDEIIEEMSEEDFAESLEEAKMDYSAKKARAGKDIGKPGKMFGKIAASAAKRYGSEERGKKVAGAVLAKLRAKSMKEEAMSEGGMPSSVIKSKQLYSRMTPAEFAKAHGDKSDDILRGMAWRHGYGKNSNHYVNKRNEGMKKEEAEQTNEGAMSDLDADRKDRAYQTRQAKTTMKHISNPTPGEKKAAKDIKPGIAGYRDRIAMLKSAQARGGLKAEGMDLVEKRRRGDDYKRDDSDDDDVLANREAYAKKHGTGQVYKKTYPGDKVGMSKSYAYDIKRTGPKGKLPEVMDPVGKEEEAENITMEFVIENTIEVSVPSTITYQDYINAIKTIVNSEDLEIQAEIVKIANEAYENDNIEVIAEAELIKQGILEAGYKATRMGDKQYSPELNLDVDRTKPGVTRVSRRIRSGEGKGTTATERRTMKRIASRTK